MEVELVLWRAAIAAPLALVLPILCLQAKARSRRLSLLQESLPLDDMSRMNDRFDRPHPRKPSTVRRKSSSSSGGDDMARSMTISLPGERAATHSRAQSRRDGTPLRT